MQDLIDLVNRDKSLPLLFKYLQEGKEPPITNRSLVLTSRILRGWAGLYKVDPPRLTMEGGTLLLKKWMEEIDAACPRMSHLFVE